MRHQEAVVWPLQRGPAAHPGAEAGAVQVDRRIAAETVVTGATGPVLFMAAPSQFRWLQAFVDEGVGRPGIDELVPVLAPFADLRVALGHVDHLDIQASGQLGPLLATPGRRRTEPGVGGHVEQRLFQKQGNEPRIGALGDYRRGPGVVMQAKGQYFLAQRIVGALRGRQGRVVVTTTPRLVAGVQVKRAAPMAQFDQRQAGHLHRQVQQEVAFFEHGRQQALAVAFVDRIGNHLHAQLRGNAGPVFAGLDDLDPGRLDA